MDGRNIIRKLAGYAERPPEVKDYFYPVPLVATQRVRRR